MGLRDSGWSLAMCLDLDSGAIFDLSSLAGWLFGLRSGPVHWSKQSFVTAQKLVAKNLATFCPFVKEEHCIPVVAQFCCLQRASQAIVML